MEISKVTELGEENNMDKKMEMAMDDIALIKTVIEKTQQDFSRISFYFILVGILNLLVWFLEEISYLVRNIMGYGYPAVAAFGWGGRILRLAGYVFLSVYFCRKVRKSGNGISEGMVKIWGIVLISSRILMYLYISLIPAGNNDKIIILYRGRELIEVLPVIFALLMTGILTKRNLITVFTAVYSILYFILFMSMKEIPYGTWGGVGTRVSASSVCIRYLMNFGMIVLGAYLRWKRSGKQLYV